MSFSSWISMVSSLKKTEAKLELLTDTDMLVIVVKRIRGGICHAIYRYVITSNKYMKDYGENKEVLYLNY